MSNQNDYANPKPSKSTAKDGDLVAAKEGYGACGVVLIVVSYILLVLTLPISIFMAIKVSKTEAIVFY